MCDHHSQASAASLPPALEVRSGLNSDSDVTLSKPCHSRADSFPPALVVRSGLNSTRNDTSSRLCLASAASFPPAPDVRSGLSSACVVGRYDGILAGKRARRASTPTRPTTKQ